MNSYSKAKRGKLIIFDCDGVLRNFSWKGVYNAYLRIGAGLGRDVRAIFPSPQDLSHDWQENLELLEISKEDEIELAQRIFIKHYFPLIKTFPWVQSVVRLLRENGFTVVVLSNSLEETLKKSLGEIEGISHILGKESVPNPKPHPEGIFRSMELSAVEPESTVMVGDSNVDIQSGKKAGVKTALVTWGATTEEKEIGDLNPDIVINHHKELQPTLFSRLI